MIMSKALVFCFSIAILANASLSAFAQESTNAVTPIPAEEVEGYLIEIATAIDTFRPMESVSLVITIKNVGKEDVRIASTTPIADFQIEVTPVYPGIINGQAVSKDRAPLTLEGKRLVQGAMQASGRTELLRRGESISVSISTLNRIFDMTLDGEYKITVRRKLPLRTDASKSVEVTSNTLVIKIKQ
jgi:hypothetical protein